MTSEAEIQWSSDFEGAVQRARDEGKSVLLDFSAAPM
jgi:hypothetical protein